MKILFFCTANSCRSILCEAVSNHLAPAGMKAYSAGSQPKGVVSPLNLKPWKSGYLDRGALRHPAPIDCISQFDIATS
ncbi:hypothetical protein D9M68_638770 [compost metagenome]